VFSSDGRLVALSVSPQQIRLAETATGRAIAHLTTLQPLDATSLAFSPDGTRLIASTNKRTAWMWNLRPIREQLRERNLDWDQPPFPPERSASTTAPLPPVRSIRVLGEALEPSARRAAELATLDERLRSHPDDGDALIQRGWVRLRMAKGAEAVADLERGVRLWPEDTDALFSLAEAYQQTNDLPAARTTLGRYLERSPDDADARLVRGQVALRLGRFEDAVDDLSRVLEDDPHRDGVRFRRADAWLRTGRSLEALADLEELIRRYPQDPTLLELRGEARQRLGDLDRARADLKRAAELPNAGWQDLNYVAWRLATGPPPLRDPERAVELARKAGFLSHDDVRCLNTLGVALYRAGRFAESIATLERSLAACNGRSDAYDLFFLAMARHRLGHTTRARADLDRAVRWLGHAQGLTPQDIEELSTFRAEAETLLASRGRELPDDVFAPVRPPPH
jgi:tetratricopeptide (TPR) repeat protein